MDPQINLDGEIFHNICAKCQDCKCQINLSNFVKNTTENNSLLLCKIHYMKRFHEGGQYIGGEKYGKKTETEKRGPSTVSITPVNSTAPGPEPESVSSPSFSEIKRRFSTTTTAADASKASEATAEGDKK
eukprot:gene26481-35140_t